MKIITHKSVLTLIIIALLILGWNILSPVYAQTKLSPELRQTLQEGNERYVNIIIQLKFGPEQFHINIFQDLGVVTKVEGTNVFMRRVPLEEIIKIARQYWVVKVVESP